MKKFIIVGLVVGVATTCALALGFILHHAAAGYGFEPGKELSALVACVCFLCPILGGLFGLIAAAIADHGCG